MTDTVTQRVNRKELNALLRKFLNVKIVLREHQGSFILPNTMCFLSHPVSFVTLSVVAVYPGSGAAHL